MKIKFKNSAPNPIKEPKKNIITVFLFGFLIIGLSALIYYGLSKILETESYYVLKTDVPAKTQVTSSMLKEVITSKDTSPQNALNIREVQQGTIYTRIPLKAGDILSESNTGLSLDSNTGIPENWGVTSFNINADDAVGGSITRGDYFDIIGVDPDEGAKYLFHNVLALDVNYNRNNTTVTPDGKVITLGELLQYKVGMPAEDIAKLHHAFSKYSTIKLAMAPVSIKYKERNVSNLTRPFVVTNNTLPSNLFNGTDPSFTPVLRDDSGRPVNEENCNEGKIEPATLCENLKPSTKTKRDKADDIKNEINSQSDEELLVEPDLKDNTEQLSEEVESSTTPNAE